MLESYEVLEVVSRACQKAADAMTKNSDGGKTFTKKETINLVIASLTDLASEYMDNESAE